MSTKLFIPFDEVHEIAMYACYAAIYDGDTQLVNGEKLKKILEGKISSNILQRHVNALYNKKMLREWNDVYKCVSDDLIRHVEAGIRNHVRPFYHLRTYGPSWLEQEYGFGNLTAELEIPAADRIVLRTDNFSAIESIRSDISVVRKAIHEDNEIGAELADDREIIDLELQVAEEVLEKPRFRLGTLFVWLLPALKFLADKFAGGAIGELAKRLITSLLGLQ